MTFKLDNRLIRSELEKCCLLTFRSLSLLCNRERRHIIEQMYYYANNFPFTDIIKLE